MDPELQQLQLPPELQNTPLFGPSDLPPLPDAPTGDPFALPGPLPLGPLPDTGNPVLQPMAPPNLFQPIPPLPAPSPDGPQSLTDDWGQLQMPTIPTPLGPLGINPLLETPGLGPFQFNLPDPTTPLDPAPLPPLFDPLQPMPGDGQPVYRQLPPPGPRIDQDDQ